MLKTNVRSQKSSRQYAVGSRQLLLTTYCLLLTVLTGCASPKGHTILAPMPPVSPEYSNAGQKIVFTNNDVKISILPLNSSETKKILTSKDANNPLADTLAAPRYLAFLLDIENLSKAQLIYNPSLTTLFDNNMGVHKPLDYTDMYSLAANLPDSEFLLNKMKDMFYDLAVTLEPGKQTSRLLLFSGMGEEVSEVTITMKEIYIGTSAIAVSFGFKIIEENEIKH